MRAVIFFLLLILYNGFLALESLNYPTKNGSIKFSETPDPNLISGKFTHFDKNIALLFHCGINNGDHRVMLTDRNGNVIVKYHTTSHGISYIQIGQYHFIVHIEADRILHIPNPDLIPKPEESDKHLNFYNQIEQSGNSNISIQHAFGVAALMREYSMAEELSRAIAEVFGPTGNQYPCVMELHMISRTMINSLSNLPHANSNNHVVKRSTDLPEESFCDVVNMETDKCDKKAGEDCIGLCGPVNYCWDWVCGDCCFHQGCADHDNCCVNVGKYGIKCLIPMNFNCNAYAC